MIDRIKRHPELSKLVVPKCCENGVWMSFAPEVDMANVVILKVDSYYNTVNFATPPKSIDCLIVRKCKGIDYGLTLVELKDISTFGNNKMEDIAEKFNTTLNDFIERRFKEELLRDFKEIKLYFVSKIEVHKRDLGLKMEALMNLRIHFQGKRLMISPVMPTPTIKNCY